MDGNLIPKKDDNKKEEKQKTPTEEKQETASLPDFDYDDLREDMGNLYDYGIGSYVTITYKGEAIFLRQVGNDEYALCDKNGNPVSDARFNKKQVTYIDAENYTPQGNAIYPEVEQAVTEYFSKLNK